MSAELVDERVVEMRFDNKDFEKNVGQSIKTINKLKDSLDFEESEKSFENISKAAERCDLKPLEKSLENVSVKFNMLEMVAAGVLTKIANEAVEAGTKFAKSLSIDQVTAGWSKYAQKTQAVQTIMSATGHTIDTVNAKLEDLIWYADETSADFVDMINNIGKFTSAGVDLDTAANAMMGISNWAFISGANIQQASRAMYNLSQAIGMGYVGVQDWKSIELANMATLEFKETVIETALELGTLQMAADGTIKTMKGTEVTAENMRSSLKEQWFSGDVLNTALAKYSEFSNEVKKFQDDWEARTGEFLNVNKAIDKMIEMEMVDIDSLGYRAFRRAQEAITLNQAIAATADAASSGWMRTFEIIFGNYEQATKLWTDLANDMWDVFAGPLESQNEHLSEIMDSNYQKLLKSLPNGQEFNQSLYEKLFKMAEENLGPEAAAALFSKYDTLEELLRNETYYSSTLRTAFDEIAVDYDKEAKDAAKLTKTLESGQLTLQQAALRLAGGVYGKDIDTQRQIVEKMGFNYEYLSELAEAWKAGEDLPWDALQKDLLKTLKEEEAYYSDFAKAVRQINPFNEFIQGLKELGGRDKLLGGFQNVIDTFKNLYLTILAIKDGIGDFLGTGSFLSNLIDGFYKVSSAFAFTDEQFEELSTNIHDFFNGGLQKKWKEFWNGSYIQSSGKYYNALTGEYEQITSYVPGMFAKISEAYDQYIGRLPEEVAKTVDNIKNTITGYFGNLPQKIKDFKEKYLGRFEEKTILSKDGITTRVKYVNQFLDDVKTKIKSFTDQGLTSILFGKKDAEGNVIKNNIFGKMGTALKMVTDSESFKKIERFILGEKDENGNVIKNNIFGKMGTAIELLTKTESFKKVERFIFGEKDENGNVIKNNIFGKMGTAIETITGSEAFKKIERFIFGEKDENGNVVKNNIFGKIGTVVETVAKSKAYKSVHDFIFGGVDDTGNPIIGLLERIKTLFDSIYNSAPFKAIRKFFGFGEEETSTNTGIKGSANTGTQRKRHSKVGELLDRLVGNDSIKGSILDNADPLDMKQPSKLTMLLNHIKEKFEELKANHPWIETLCNFITAQIENIRKLIDDAGGSLSKLIENIRKYLFGYDKKKDGILGFFGGKEHINGLVDNIKEVFNGIFSGGKETKKESIFTKLLNVFTGKSGLSIFSKKGPSILSMLKAALVSITGINVAFSAFTIKAASKLQFKSPLEDLVDGLKSFVESIAIIAGTLIGLQIFIKAIKLEGLPSLIVAGALIGLIIYSLIKIIKTLNKQDVGWEIALVISSIASAVVQIGLLMAALTLLIKYTDSAEQLKLVAGIMIALVLVVGVAGRLMTRVADEGKQIKTAAGSFFGVAAMMIALGSLLTSIIIAFAAVYFITRNKPISEFYDTFKILGGAIVAILFTLRVITNAAKDLSGAKPIPGTILTLVISFMAFSIVLIGAVKILTIGTNWQTLAAAFGGIALVVFALAEAVKIISNIKNVNLPNVGKSLLAMMGILGILSIFIFAINKIFSSNNSRIKGSVNSGGPMATLQQLPSLLLAIVELAVAMIPISGALKLVSSIKLSMKDCLNFSKNLAGVGVLALAVWGLAEIQARANITSWKSLVPMFIAIGEVVVAAFVLTGALALLGVMGSALSGTILAGFLTLGAIALGILAIMGIMKLGEIAGNQLIDIVVSISGRVRDELLPALSDFTLEDVGKVGILSAIMLGIFTTEALTLLSEIVSSFISIEGIDSMLTDLVTYANKIKNDLLPAVEDFTDDDPEKVGRLSKIAKNVFTVEAFQALSNLISNISPSAETESMLTNLVTYANKIKDDLLPAVRDFKEDDLTQLVRLSSLAKNVFTVAAFEKLTELVGKYTNVGNVTGMLTDLASYATTLKEKFLPAVSGLTDGDKDKAGLLADIMAAVFVSEVFNTLIGFVGKIGKGSELETIANGLSDVVTDLTPFLESVRTLDESDVKKAGFVPKVLSSVFGSQLFTGGIKLTQWLADSTNYKELFKNLTRENGVLDGVKVLSDKLDEISGGSNFTNVGSAADAISSVFELLGVMGGSLRIEESKGFVSGLKDIFGKDALYLSDIEEALSSITTVILPQIMALQKGLTDNGIEADYIKNTLGVYIDMIKTIFDLAEMKGNAIDFSSFEQIGDYIVVGLVNSLTSEDNTNAVYVAAYNLGLTIIEALKAGTEEKSPSKASKRVGQFIADGLMIGLMSGEKLTYDLARAFGENTIKALEDGVNHYADRGVTQHAINMVTEDLLDEHIFDMPDFTTKHRFGHEIVDFEAMEKWMHENFDEHIGVDAIHNFVGAYRQEQEELAKTITDPEYAALMQKISAGDYGLGGQSIVSALERELGTRQAANQAWEDWNDLAKGTIKINDKLIKQQKNMPIMTEEQWDEMWAHDEEGRQKRMSGYFDELARINGTDWRTEAEKEGFDADFIQRMVNKEWSGSGMDMESYFRHLAEAELEAEHADKKKSESAQSVVGASKEVTETVNAETDALKEYNTATEETTSIYDNLSDSVKGAVDKIFPDLEKKLKENKGKLNISLIDLLKPIGGDEVASFLELVPGIKDLEFEFDSNNFTKDNLGIFFNTLFGDSFGKQEKGFTDYLSMIKKVFEGGNAFENVAKAFNTAFLRAEDTAETMEKMNETGIDPKVDYSGVAAFNAYLDDIYKKYELLGEGNSFGSVARSGVERLQNGAKVTEKQAQEIQKILDKGMMTGAEGIKKELEAVGVEWTELLSLVGGSSKVNWTPLTQNKGLDYAETVKELGEAYTITQLMEDSNKGLFGETATERKEAYAAANLDAVKAEELFQEWLKKGGEALEGQTKDYLDLSDAEKDAIKKQELYNQVLEQTTEGSFMAISDFLENVTKVIEEDNVAGEFNDVMKSIAATLKEFVPSNADDYEKVANFLMQVREISKNSTAVSADFGKAINSIISDINSTEPLDESKTKPLVEFLNNVMSASEAISDSTVGVVIANLAFYMITLFEGYYSEFTRIGETYTINIANGMVAHVQDAMVAGAAVAGAIMAGFGDAINSDANKASLSKVSDALKDACTISIDGEALADNLVRGLVEGLAERSKYVAKAMALVAKGVIFTADEIFEINSPSKVFHKMGKYIMEGLGNGLTDSESGLMHNVTDVASGTVDTFSSVISSISDDIESDFADGPVIRPVVDMSDVYNSASNIDAALSRDRAFSISAGEYNKAYQNGVDGNGYGTSGPTFIQNNYSPKPLSRLEIYRQTKNQFAMMQNT